MLWSELLDNISGESKQFDSDCQIHHLLFDSRLLGETSRTIFFAIKTKRQDGHTFIESLYAQGVRCFVIESDQPYDSFPEANFLLVNSSLLALQEATTYKRELFSIPTIAITGSNGKTSTKEWLSSLLSERFAVIKTPKSFNSQIGVPLSVWQIGEQHQIGVFEAGISQPGEMTRLERILKPDIGIFTSIGPAHDEGFISRDQKIHEKSNLFINSKNVICCRDHTELFESLQVRFGDRLADWSTKLPDAKFYYEIGKKVFLKYKGQQFTFSLPFNFEIWVENALHSITAAILCGLSEEEIQKGLDSLQAVDMRLEVKHGINNCYLIDDTYNNDLQGLSAALDFLKQQVQNNKKTVVMTDILQSALSDEQLFARVHSLLNNHKIDRLIGIGEKIGKYLRDYQYPIESYQSTEEFLENIPEFSNEMILIKGARKFRLERVVSRLSAKKHRTQLEINFESITHNLNQYRSKLAKETKVMAMVKAFGYGGGSLEIANLLQFHRVDYLGVAYLDEAIELRKNGIDIPIMVMSPGDDSLEDYARYDLQPEVYDLATFEEFAALKSKPKIHIKLETGMHRQGFDQQELKELLDHPKWGELEIGGVFTHFAAADEEEHDQFTHEQDIRFETMFEKLTSTLDNQPLKYVANSSAAVRFPEYHFDMVRIGIGLYGFDPAGELSLRQIGRLTTRVTQVKTVSQSETIGYGRKGVLDKESEIATIPVGYADGYSRKFGNGNAYIMIGDKKAKTIGNICMDMTMLDVTGLGVKPGDEVIVYGENPSVVDLAKWADTIPYEILTSISQRVKRVYISK